MARKPQENPKADLTPMIDVVFQLMIFFVVTIKQEDIFSKLNANRPAPNASSSQSESNDSQVRIDVGPGGLLLNGRSMSLREFDRNMKELSKTSKKATVLVRCTMNSPHRFLVNALDTCYKYEMYNVSIFSM
ncbi:MAG: biopolymer transporter ExbD [Kiritimatiellae bacterium]|jgi:biopolymer transport protein ExbD|nr:biopolymer transporter ExbD [Kiritimatiellia bacterium]